MYCPHCGEQIPDDSKFCHYCGKAIGVIPSSQLSQTTQSTTPAMSSQTVVYNLNADNQQMTYKDIDNTTRFASYLKDMGFHDKISYLDCTVKCQQTDQTTLFNSSEAYVCLMLTGVLLVGEDDESSGRDRYNGYSGDVGFLPKNHITNVDFQRSKFQNHILIQTKLTTVHLSYFKWSLQASEYRKDKVMNILREYLNHDLIQVVALGNDFNLSADPYYLSSRRQLLHLVRYKNLPITDSNFIWAKMNIYTNNLQVKNLYHRYSPEISWGSPMFLCHFSNDRLIMIGTYQRQDDKWFANHIILTVPYNEITQSIMSIKQGGLKGKMFNNTKHLAIRTHDTMFYVRARIKYNNFSKHTWQGNLSHSNVGLIDNFIRIVGGMTGLHKDCVQFKKANRVGMTFSY